MPEVNLWESQFFHLLGHRDGLPGLAARVLPVESCHQPQYWPLKDDFRYIFLENFDFSLSSIEVKRVLVFCDEKDYCVWTKCLKKELDIGLGM